VRSLGRLSTRSPARPRFCPSAHASDAGRRDAASRRVLKVVVPDLGPWPGNGPRMGPRHPCEQAKGRSVRQWPRHPRRAGSGSRGRPRPTASGEPKLRSPHAARPGRRAMPAEARGGVQPFTPGT
jgi:hypothetical protein